MSQYNAMDLDYAPVSLFDKPALFTNARIDRDTVPDGLYAYDIRHGDDGDAATVEKAVRVNHMGTVITAEPLDFGEADYIPLDYEECDLNFAAKHDCGTVAEFRQYISEMQQAQGDEPAMTQEMA
jgi:demethoxyubiquinone hydroxylase (CLK1/Coq7/Cat5 family)